MTDLERVIAEIPAMEQTDFERLTQAVLCRLNAGLQPLTAEQWAAKLDHSLAQADRGELRSADDLAAHIRGKYRRTASGAV